MLFFFCGGGGGGMGGGGVTFRGEWHSNVGKLISVRIISIVFKFYPRW